MGLGDQEVFRLLIVAFQNSMEALPVLSYFMAVLVLFTATGIYIDTWRSAENCMMDDLK